MVDTSPSKRRREEENGSSAPLFSRQPLSVVTSNTSHGITPVERIDTSRLNSEPLSAVEAVVVNVQNGQYHANGYDVNAALEKYPLKPEITYAHAEAPSSAIPGRIVQSSLSKISRSVSNGIESTFYFYGNAVATYPLLFILLCLVLTGICSIGLVTLQTESRPYKLWIPQDSDFIRIQDWQAKNFPGKYRYHAVLYEADNVLDKRVLLELLRVHEIVAGIVAKITKGAAMTDAELASSTEGAAAATSGGHSNDSHSNSSSYNTIHSDVLREIRWKDVCVKLPSLTGSLSIFGRKKRSLRVNGIETNSQRKITVNGFNDFAKQETFQIIKSEISDTGPIENGILYDVKNRFTDAILRDNYVEMQSNRLNFPVVTNLQSNVSVKNFINDNRHDFNAVNFNPIKHQFIGLRHNLLLLARNNENIKEKSYRSNAKKVGEDKLGISENTVKESHSNYRNSRLQRPKRQGGIDWSSYLPRGSYCTLVENMGKECFEKSILEIWGYNRHLLESLTPDEIIEAINTKETSAIFGYKTNFTEYLGGVTRDDAGRIVAAKAMKQTWLSRVNADRVVKGKYIDDFGTGVEVDVDSYMWEEVLVQTLLNETKRSGDLNLYFMSAGSFGKIFVETIYGDLGLLAVGYFVVFVYVTIMLGKFNCLEMRPVLSLLGITSVIMSIIISYGLASAFGLKFGVVNNILPFLLLGLGIDDMFVIMQAWNNLTPEERRETLPVRVGCAMKHAGASVTVTSATDIVAFAIGSGTVLPALRSFCIYAAIGIAAIFFLQATFFVACFTFDQRRIESKRNGLICCWKMAPTYKPNECSQRDICQTFFKDIYAKYLLKPAVKVGVLLFTVALFAVSCWGLSNLRQEFDAVWFMPPNSYPFKFIMKHREYYPAAGISGVIYFGNISLYEELPNIEKFISALEADEHIGEVESWYKSYKKYLEEQGYTVPDAHGTISGFQDDLSSFLHSSSGSRYRDKNFKFTSPLLCSEPAPVVTASSIDFKYKLTSETSQKLAAMHAVKNLTKTSNISGFVAAFSPVHSGWETDEIIEKELYQNLSLAVLVVFLMTFALIASMVQSLFVLSCVVMTLVDVGAMMHWWGLTIDTVACIYLVLAVGLCVDYAAHVGHTFMTVQGSRNTRARLTLARIGPAVLNGGFSTFLAFVFLANSNAHVFMSFFKIFFGVCLYGLFHGLVYLPVLLSLIGPKPYAQLPAKSQKSNWNLDSTYIAAAGRIQDTEGGGISTDNVGIGSSLEVNAVTNEVDNSKEVQNTGSNALYSTSTEGSAVSPMLRHGDLLKEVDFELNSLLSESSNDRVDSSSRNNRNSSVDFAATTNADMNRMVVEEIPEVDVRNGAANNVLCIRDKLVAESDDADTNNQLVNDSESQLIRNGQQLLSNNVNVPFDANEGEGRFELAGKKRRL